MADNESSLILETPDVRGRELEKTKTKRSKSRSRSRPHPSASASSEDIKTRVSDLESLMKGMQTQVDDLEVAMDMLTQENAEISTAAKQMMVELADSLKSQLKIATEELASHKKSVGDEIRAIREELENLKREMKTPKRTFMLGNYGAQVSSHTSIKVPKPDMYNGTRNAAIVENFIFGLEQYFEAMGVNEDAAKIGNAPAFLRDSAQLWWRRKYTEREKGLCNIETWDQFKKELKKHFVPRNATEEALGKLRRLRQKGKIANYIKEFTTTMLEIEELSERDALFYFKDGLQDWAKAELNRRDVHTLDDAIAIAETITDYSTKDATQSSYEEENERSEKDTKDRSPSPKRGRSRSKILKPSRPCFHCGEMHWDQDCPKKFKSKPTRPCFICDGHHWTRNCPQKAAMNALVATMAENQKEDQQAQISTIQYLGALVQAMPKKEKEEQDYGLQYAKVRINNKETRALIDTGASHNFMDINEAKRLGINYTPSRGTVKAVNTKATQIFGTTKVRATMGTWSKHLTFTIIKMDDHVTVLGQPFFHEASAFPIPKGRSLIILDDHDIRVIELMKKDADPAIISSLQYKKTPTPPRKRVREPTKNFS